MARDLRYVLRDLRYVLSAGVLLLALGCGDSSRESSPTSPDFAPSSTGCDLSTARGLVNSVFPNSAKQTANNLLQAIQSAGSGTAAATNAGFDLFALIAANRPVNPENSSAFVNAIIPCQDAGTVSLPIDFTGALGPNGAFEVRGGSATNTAAAVSVDGAWGLEPPLNLSVTPVVRYTWDLITVTPQRFNPASNPANKRFLVYGAPVAVEPDAFTTETLVGTVFDWSTIPTLAFNPGAVVGTCIVDDLTQQYLIQHHATANNGEIVPSATPSFCPQATLTGSRDGSWSRYNLAQRIFNIFRPQPLLAAALATRPPGGSIRNLSPSAAVNPGQITLLFEGQVADGSTGQALKFTDNQPVSVKVTPFGLTRMDGVLVKLIATTNFGATVVATGNEVATEDGIATFPNLKINKAGGYRLIATIAAFGQNNNTGFQFQSITSNGFNLKRSK